MRLERRERGAVERDRLDAEWLELIGLGMRQLPPTRAAIGFDPAAGAQEPRGARVLRELQVLVRRGE